MPHTELPTPSVNPAPPTDPVCGTCALNHASQLLSLGVDVSGHDHVVALAGNPNTGKSTVFNALTGLRQHVGNWPGKTVIGAEGGFGYRDRRYKLVDLPGTYSLLSTSEDEDVARDFLVFGRPDVTVVVVDATRLQRNLNLVLQILQITDRVVLALNLVDEARRHGLSVDERHLARELGVPVVPMAARSRQGVPDLLETVERVALGTIATRARPVHHGDVRTERAVSELAHRIQREYPELTNTRWIALRLLEGDPGIERAVTDGTLGRLAAPAASTESFTDRSGKTHS
ncbi:Ferrous iron transport protein B [Actinopolyspora xinjiangensis]|uniref:Ferrous iron transport protein B n=1 Tax=Actinopolyspora xinjiangensis TaxID=405564 RepID=A0A1H0RF09_9ACTN|nr:FeoB small GTPase domain-containing protein [Actinopolyspora xinjiangensis]SDP28143.1 Ferrous iron transport protein B [Actinopolyspora xinjiangensis]